MLPKSGSPKSHPQPRRQHPSAIPRFLVESTVTSKGQVTIPQAIRSLLGLHAGDSIVWSRDKEGHLTVGAARTKTLADIRAALAAIRTPTAVRAATEQDIEDAVASALAEKYGRR